MATDAEYVRIETNNDIKAGLSKARAFAKQNRAVILYINIDYSKATALQGEQLKPTLNVCHCLQK